MQVNSGVCVTRLPHLDKWFHDAMSYDDLKKALLSRSFKALTVEDKDFLLAFVARKGWLHLAVAEKDWELIMSFEEAGADLSAVDEKGYSILVYAKKADMFCWLQEKGAKFIHKDKSLLEFLFNRYGYYGPNHRMDGESKKWYGLFCKMIARAPLEDYCSFSSNNQSHLALLAKNNLTIRDDLLNIAQRIIQEKPNEAFAIARNLLTDYRYDSDFKEGFISLIKMIVVKDSLIEQIVTDPKIALFNMRDINFFKNLGSCWKPTNDLLKLVELCKDLRFGIYIKALLNTSTLKEAAPLYSCLTEFSATISQLDESIKIRLQNHIIALQTKEKSTIWFAMAAITNSSCYSEKILLLMKELDFNPKWVDPINQQTFLFTKATGIFSKGKNQLGFDLLHVDIHGNNALEHHCRNFTEYTMPSLKIFSKLGLELRDQFPNVQKCRSTFPNNPYLQAALGTCLLSPGKFNKRAIIDHTPRREYPEFYEAVRNDPELKMIMGKAISQSYYDWESQQQSENQKNWKKCFHQVDVARLDKLLSKEQESELFYLTKFWGGIVPSDILNVIPESPLASLVVGAFRTQHHEIVEKRIKIAASPKKLFVSALTHDDLVYLNKYIFLHPEFMRILIQDYMYARVIDIRPNGDSRATYGDFVSKVMIRMGKLSQLSDQGQLPKWHQKLLGAFNKFVTPFPVETLDIPNDANVRLLGRTVIVTSTDGCEAFKFLKKGERYDYFAQEHSVCQALHELGNLKSQIIKPIGVYAVKHMPSALKPYQHLLPGNKARCVFHYKAMPETFVYLQDVLPEKYAESRNKVLHDAAKLIRLGIYPDLAAMFHYQQDSRRYVLLVELMGHIANCIGVRRCAGDLEAPFIQTQYPNARESGMTDWRDACLYYDRGNSLNDQIKDMLLSDKEKDGVTYYYQMTALSNILLIDMLILAERYIKEGHLQWKNDDLNQKFGLELAAGFAQLTAYYSDQSHEQSLKFAMECGIDWTRAARQIAFWLDTGPEGYPKWMVQEKVPHGLYEDNIKVTVKVSQAKNFDVMNGFRTNGSPDIGVCNGPLALDEFEKAAHLLFNTVALAEPLVPLQEPVIHNPKPIRQNFEFDLF